MLLVQMQTTVHKATTEVLRHSRVKSPFEAWRTPVLAVQGERTGLRDYLVERNSFPIMTSPEQRGIQPFASFLGVL